MEDDLNHLGPVGKIADGGTTASPFVDREHYSVIIEYVLIVERL